MIRHLILLSFSLIILTSPAWSKTIVVVGGGLAGLTTAYEIQKAIETKKIPADTQLQLFEARERIGGRVFTVLLHGKPAELGGENINDGGDALQLRRIAAELGVQITSRDQPPVDRYFYDAKTKVRTKYDDLKPFFPKLTMEELVAALQKSEKNARNVSEVLDNFFAMFPVAKKSHSKQRALLRRLIEENMHGFEGGPAKNLSPRYAHGSLIDITKTFLTRPRKPYPVDSITGGNARLAIALAEKLKGKISLGHPLTAVAPSNDGGYKLMVAGKKVQADILVLAIPCKPYANIQFAKDVIPSDRLQQILDVGYGTHAKILIPITTEPSKELPVTNGVAVWQRLGDLWLTAYFTGPQGIMRDQAEFKTGAAILEKAFRAPAPFKNVSEFVVPTAQLSEHMSPVSMSWATDPFAGGSYSYYTPNLRHHLESNVSVEGLQVLKLFAPIDGRLFFAGEHTTIDQDIRGTMEAAVDSGVRTAQLVEKLHFKK